MYAWVGDSLCRSMQSLCVHVCVSMYVYVYGCLCTRIRFSAKLQREISWVGLHVSFDGCEHEYICIWHVIAYMYMACDCNIYVYGM